MKTLVLANQKGGVGKSAVGTQLAYYLVQRALRVLFIDLDHQKNSTKPIMKSGRATAASFTASQLLAGEGKTVPDANFVIVQGDDTLSSLERQPDKHNAIVNSLKAFLESVADKFDVCIIDTNPNPDIRYAGALITSDFVLSPIQLNQEAIDGIGSLLNHQRYGYRKIKAALNPGLELIGILPNMVEPTPFQRGNFCPAWSIAIRSCAKCSARPRPRALFWPTSRRPPPAKRGAKSSRLSMSSPNVCTSRFDNGT